MSEKLIDKTAAAAGEWWAARLGEQFADKRELFSAAVAERVAEALHRHPHLYLECDYDPAGLLLEAVRAVGIDCRGSFFSARGILPSKHELEIKPGLLSPKEGYGNWTADIKVSAGRTALNLSGGGEG